jgi:GT2 family glycosyltransferase/lipopolysaccharide/colanic/teichoic acid biosynthesis glycosyltransferase
MKKNRITISVIIVNYNVKEYLAQLLLSLERALQTISHEIIIVDNHSIDGSVQFLKDKNFKVRIIENDENLGFGRANNQALKICKGKYVVLINPDTVVQENTFSRMIDFFDNTPDASVATCKIIDPAGNFSVDCRHSIPTPSVALWKVLGLSKLFPKSRIFGQYNMTYLNSDQTYSIPAISGSFMMMKKEVLDQVGLFDEQFFMYCEDIDLCHRITQAGFKIYYFPETQIIHYKGESTKKDNLDYVKTFNKSLYQFFQKYYAPKSIFLFRWLVMIGILLRGAFIYVKSFLKNQFPLLLDILIFNLVILGAFIIRLNFGRGFFWEDFFDQYWVINLIATILFISISYYFEIYPNHRFSIQSIIKANVATFILLATLTFFLKQFAFSRMVVLISFLIAPLIMISWRIIIRRTYRGDKAPLGRDLFSKRTAVIGNGKDANELFTKLQTRKSIDYDLIGWISVKDDSNNATETKYLGAVKNLNDIVRIYHIQQLIFSAHSLSYAEILKTMTSTHRSRVEFKMVPSNLDVIIGKSMIEKLDDYPLVDIDYSIGKGFNRVVKRGIDILLSLPIVITLYPFVCLTFLFRQKRIEKISLYDQNFQAVPVSLSGVAGKKGIVFYWSMYFQVLSGRFTIVGAPIQSFNQTNENKTYLYKPGLTGLVQINKDKIVSLDDADKYHLYYLKNQSILLDFEIMLKAVWRRITGK